MWTSVIWIGWATIKLGKSWSYDSWIYNYLRNQCLSPLKLWARIPLDTTICNKVYSYLQVFGFLWVLTPVSSTNKSDCHNITVILLKVVLITITLTLYRHLRSEKKEVIFQKRYFKQSDSYFHFKILICPTIKTATKTVKTAKSMTLQRQYYVCYLW